MAIIALQEWYDLRLVWDSYRYDTRLLDLPAEDIWTPDIVLYNK